MDDILILCQTQLALKRAKALFYEIINPLGLSLAMST